MSGMRVMHVVNSINGRSNGITNVVVDLAAEQASQGIDVLVVSAGGHFGPLLEAAGARLATVDLTRDRRTRRRSPRRVLRAVLEVRRLVRGFKPDVVHVHTMTAAVVTRAAAPRARIVATVHNEYQHGVMLMAVADRVVGVSIAVSAAMRGRGIPARRIATVHNGTVGSPRRAAEAGEARPAGPSTIVSIGAVSPRKGADVLLDAFERVREVVPDAELLLLGGIDHPEILEARSGRPLLQYVHAPGIVPQPQHYLTRGTVFAMPSRRDPFPLALLEALEAGCAIVGSDVDGIPEALEHGRSGILVPAKDPDALAQALVRLLTDATLRARLAAAAVESSRRYSVRRMSEDYLSVYRSIVSPSA